MASDEVKRVVDKIYGPVRRATAASDADLRARSDALWPDPPPEVRVTSDTIAGVPGRWVVAPEAGTTTIVHLHGGGFTRGSSISHRDLAARISSAARAQVFLPDYALAPERVFPAALDDAVAVCRGMVERRVPATRLFVSGDSAGGGLALSAVLQLVHESDLRPAGVFTMSPWADLTLESESFSRNEDIDPLGTVIGYRRMAADYLGDHDPRDPFVSPCFADFDGFPPLLVQAGSSELIVDDAIRVVEAARLAGVPAELQLAYQMCHVYQLIGGFAATTRALQEVGRFVTRWAGTSA